jgi:hypothetical protein
MKPQCSPIFDADLGRCSSLIWSNSASSGDLGGRSRFPSSYGESVGVLIFDDNFGLYDRKSRRAQLSIRYGDRNYDRSTAGPGTGKAQRYFASDFDRFFQLLVRPQRDRSYEASSKRRFRRRWRLAPRYCACSARTATQYWIEKKSTKAN